MTLAALPPLGLLISISLIVMSLGARSSVASALCVLQRPAVSARALGAIFVVVPAFAVLLAATLPLPASVRFAIVAMSVAPLQPALAYKQIKAGGEADYAVGLMVAACVASMLLTPLLVALAAALLGTEASIGVGKMVSTLLLSIGAPLAVGMLLHAVARGAADPIANVAQKVGFLVLLASFLMLLASAWREVLHLVGDGTVLAIAATVAVGLLAGHLLGRGAEGGSLALAAATRNPGIALAIADASFPDQTKPILAALLLYILITAAVSAVYLRWMRGRSVDPKAPAAPAA
jgi:BASS family bile acid:Na+ symporter